MKVIIAGSRDIRIVEKNLFECVEESPFKITEVVSGGARGVDKMGEYYAKCKGLPIKQFIPDWDGRGRGAGYIRNAEMAEYADALIAVWDGKSKGTVNMVEQMYKLNKPVKMFVFP